MQFPANGSKLRIQVPEGNRSRKGSRRDQQERVSPVDNMLANFDEFTYEWKNHGELVEKLPNQYEEDFICLAAMDSMSNLSFVIGIPLEKIHPQGFAGINDFSVGFGVPMSRMGGMAARSGQDAASMGSSQMGGRSGGGRMGGGGGGRGGSRGGGSMGGGSMGEGQSGAGMASSGPTVEKFWYRTTLGRSK